MTGTGRISHLRLALLVCAIFGLPATAAEAQPGGQAAGRAEAEVVVPINVVQLSDLSFGSIAANGFGEASVKVAANGSPPRYVHTARPGCSGQSECLPHRASFGVSGEANRDYRVAVPSAVMAVGVRTGVGLPVVDIEVRGQNGSSATGGGRLDNAGRDTLFVGGTLRVPGGTRPDIFRAEFSVIVTYD